MENRNQGKTDKCLAEFRDFLRREKGERFIEEVIKKIEQLRDESFLDGYQYAIQMLMDGMAKKDHT